MVTLRTRAVRVGLLALLVGALVLPVLVAAAVRPSAAGSACRCSNHACCTNAQRAACPLARAGKRCERTDEASGPGMRAGCGCHQGGETGMLAHQKPGVCPAQLGQLESARESSHRYFVQPERPASPAATPEPPPPRLTLRPA